MSRITSYDVTLCISKDLQLFFTQKEEEEIEEIVGSMFKVITMLESAKLNHAKMMKQLSILQYFNSQFNCATYFFHGSLKCTSTFKSFCFHKMVYNQDNHSKTSHDCFRKVICIPVISLIRPTILGHQVTALDRFHCRFSFYTCTFHHTTQSILSFVKTRIPLPSIHCCTTDFFEQRDRMCPISLHAKHGLATPNSCRSGTGGCLGRT